MTMRSKIAVTKSHVGVAPDVVALQDLRRAAVELQPCRLFVAALDVAGAGEDPIRGSSCGEV